MKLNAIWDKINKFNISQKILTGVNMSSLLSEIG